MILCHKYISYISGFISGDSTVNQLVDVMSISVHIAAGGIVRMPVDLRTHSGLFIYQLGYSQNACRPKNMFKSVHTSVGGIAKMHVELRTCPSLLIYQLGVLSECL